MSTLYGGRAGVCSYEDCGSRQFVVENDGFTYCSRGHQQAERGALVAEDTGDLIVRGKTTRRHGSDVESVSSKASGYQGQRALEQYLLCLQLVLRKQIQWLIASQKLPARFEAVVKDIWSLRLRQISALVPSMGIGVSDSENYYSSSQSEGETMDSRSPRRPNGSSHSKRVPGLLDLLAICYLGVLLMRQPITISDIHLWAQQGQMAFYQTNRIIPITMRTRLPARYQDMLLPQTLGTAQRLHNEVMKLSANLERDFGWQPAAINEYLILYRWIRELTLPIDTLSSVKKLRRLLHHDTRMHSEATVANALRSPLTRLMALLIISVKLDGRFSDQHPPDSQRAGGNLQTRTTVIPTVQRPMEPSLPLTDVVDLGVPQADLSDLSEARAAELQPSQLDSYLDWYETTLASHDGRELEPVSRGTGLQSSLSRLFLTSTAFASTKSEVTSTVLAPSSRIATPSTRKPILLAGTPNIRVRTENNGHHYSRFAKQKSLPESWKVFYKRTALLAGTDVDFLLRAVYLFEARLLQLERTLRRS